MREAFPEAVEIAGLHVGESSRGLGIGTALIEYAERLATRAGRRVAVIGVADDNPRAAGLYRRMGYVATGINSTVRYELPGPDGAPIAVAEHVEALMKRLPAGGSSGAPA